MKNKKKRTRLHYSIITLVLLLLSQNILGQATVDCIRLASDTTGNCTSDIRLNQSFYFKLSGWDNAYNNVNNIILYINNAPMPNYVATSVNVDQKCIYFTISNKQSDKNKTIVDLVRNDFQNYDYQISLIPGVGLKDGTKAISAARQVNFIFFNPTLGVVEPIGCLVIFILLFFLLNRFGAFNDIPGQGSTKSIGNFQFCFWVLIVAFVYFSLWLILHEAPKLPDSILGLLLINISTSAGSQFIPTVKNFKSDDSGNLKGFRSLFIDKDGNITISRLQYFIFTILFGIIFAWTALTELRVYDFNIQQLALMGVSSSGYLGFKLLNAK